MKLFALLTLIGSLALVGCTPPANEPAPTPPADTNAAPAAPAATNAPAAK